MLRSLKKLPVSAYAASVLLVAGAGIAGAQERASGVNAADAVRDIVPSSREGALIRPEDWDCGYVVPEWEEWLDQGNRPEDWRWADDTFRDVEDGELYTWKDWLDWFEDAGCPPGGLIDGTQAAASSAGAAGGVSPGVIGGVLGGLGLVSVVAGASGGTDSPG